jgi:16S rRNA (adenine1518-N6/adenine1519-N6)-dimethyltransferase
MSDNATLRQRLTVALDQAGLAPNHRLGQNFMIDSRSLSALAEYIPLDANSRAVEIGPGTGFLTERILASGASLLSVELDCGLYGYLQQRFADELASGQFQLVHGDALANKTTLHPAIVEWAQAGPWNLIANLPYDISIPAILNALTMEHAADGCAVTVQYEAAQRLVSEPNTKSWGATSIVAQAAGSGRIAAKFPRQCFYPPPRVESALLHWQREGQVPNGFTTWCRTIFAYRRKVITRALRDSGLSREEAQDAVAAMAWEEGLRVEQLSVAQLLALHAFIADT